MKVEILKIYDTVEGYTVGDLNYFKALNIDTIDVSHIVDIILKNLWHTDPTDLLMVLRKLMPNIEAL